MRIISFWHQIILVVREEVYWTLVVVFRGLPAIAEGILQERWIGNTDGDDSDLFLFS